MKMNTNGVVTVGGGRGFVMEHRVYFDFGDDNGYRKLRRKVVVTASDCLPHAPKVMFGVDYKLATYAKLLAPLGGEPTSLRLSSSSRATFGLTERAVPRTWSFLGRGYGATWKVHGWCIPASSLNLIQ